MQMLDGVAVFERPATTSKVTASLMFRAGRVDETLPTAGWLHLIEHAVLESAQYPLVQVNGSVGPLLTTLDVRGQSEQVGLALRGIVAALTRMDSERITHERNVLRAEARTKGPNLVTRAFLERFGAQGIGLLGFGEVGLMSAEPDALAAVVQRYFTTGNAALAIDGPVPDTLSLAGLPPGKRIPVPQYRAVAPPNSWYREPSGVVLQGLVPRGLSARLAAMALSRRGWDEVRTSTGLPRDTDCVAEHVTADEALMMMSCSASEQQVQMCSEALLRAAHHVADQGVDDQELGAIKRAGIRFLAGRRAGNAEPWMRAESLLVNGQPLGAPELREEIEATRPEEVAAVAQRMLDSLLVGAVSEQGVPHWLQRPRLEDPELSGARFPALAAPELITMAGSQLHWAHLRDQHRMTIDLADCAAVLAWPDGLREVIRHDGYAMAIEPNLWRRGDLLVRRIDQVTPPRQLLWQPGRDVDLIPGRPGLRQRLRRNR
ncbi:hypothetical protein [Enemella sp. A6]|uniref:hypothetical protein n=1 Tax=Enemella sp. A6 TaxID=3440152 RepID=UPI003EBE0F6F